jgi:hypothetical protein
VTGLPPPAPPKRGRRAPPNSQTASEIVPKGDAPPVTRKPIPKVFQTPPSLEAKVRSATSARTSPMFARRDAASQPAVRARPACCRVVEERWEERPVIPPARLYASWDKVPRKRRRAANGDKRQTEGCVPTIRTETVDKLILTVHRGMSSGTLGLTSVSTRLGAPR